MLSAVVKKFEIQKRKIADNFSNSKHFLDRDLKSKSHFKDNF